MTIPSLVPIIEDDEELKYPELCAGETIHLNSEQISAGPSCWSTSGYHNYDDDDDSDNSYDDDHP